MNLHDVLNKIEYNIGLWNNSALFKILEDYHIYVQFALCA